MATLIRDLKFEYKQGWFARLDKHASALLEMAKEPVILAGDFNVMPTELDVYKPERWVDDALFRIEIRDAYKKLVDQGWTDALRKLYPKRNDLYFLGLFQKRIRT